MNKRPHEKRQKLNISGSTVQGQVGQALRDLWQLQFLFLGKGSSEQEELQNRKVLIDKVRNFWIQGVLEKSLYNQVLIELNLEKRLDAVEQPFKLDWVTPERIKQSTPVGTRIIDLFNQMGQSTTLLILGDPGAGKTITLLEFGRDLLARAEKDVNYPIPVVFNLSSWGIKKQSIAEWLVYELKEKYQVPLSLGQGYIQEEGLLLLLDGLDEVRSDSRADCVLALNQFNQEYGRTAKIVCSRIKDYDSLSEKLRFQSAVFIQPLTDTQVNQYLLMWGDDLSSVRSLAQDDVVFQELLKTPLMLNITALAYSGISIQEFSANKSSQEHTSEIFDAYINRMFFRRRIRKDLYKENKSKLWLVFLAKKMKSSSQSVFLIENLQPAMWLNSFEDWLYGFFVSLVLTPVMFLIIAIALGSSTLLAQADGDISRLGLTDPNLYYQSFFVILLVLLLAGMCSVLIAPIYATFQMIARNSEQGEIQVVNELKWSWKKIRPALFLYLIGVLILPYSYTILYLFSPLINKDLSKATLIEYLFLGILIYPYPLIIPLIWVLPKVNESIVFQDKMINIKNQGEEKESHLNLIVTTWFVTLLFNFAFTFFASIYMMILGLIGILMSGRIAIDIDSSETPNQGLWNSSKNSILFALICMVSFGFSAILFGFMIMRPPSYTTLISLGFTCGICAGALLGGYGGGGAIIQHISLRFVLFLRKKTPWNYSEFLDYAVERIFMQKVGGGYMFIHRLLLEHFAEMK